MTLFSRHRAADAYAEIQNEADTARARPTLDAMLEELAGYGKVTLRQHDKIFVKQRVWYVIVHLASRLEGVTGEVQSAEFDNPRAAVENCLQRCRAAMKR